MCLRDTSTHISEPKSSALSLCSQPNQIASSCKALYIPSDILYYSTLALLFTDSQLLVDLECTYVGFDNTDFAASRARIRFVSIFRLRLSHVLVGDAAETHGITGNAKKPFARHTVSRFHVLVNNRNRFSADVTNRQMHIRSGRNDIDISCIWQIPARPSLPYFEYLANSIAAVR
jgi:hypothetical protein